MSPATADPPAPAGNADREEVARFEALAGEWWDPSGKFRPLHKLGPARLGFIRRHACGHFRRGPAEAAPLAGLTVLDIGCGGGLLCEPLAQLGAAVTGIDPGEANLEAARRHAAQSGLGIRYRRALAEDLAKENARFDIVLAMEVVEHVPDLAAFLGAACSLVAPGGLFFAATLNRTLKSYLLAIVGAEYVLGWLPRGTHDWQKFLRPSELAKALDRHGLDLVELSGVTYNPLGDRWRLSSDLDVNYMAAAAKPAAP